MSIHAPQYRIYDERARYDLQRAFDTIASGLCRICQLPLCSQDGLTACARCQSVPRLRDG